MGRPKREGSSGAVPVEDEDNFVRLLLHALGNKSIASKLKEALGVTEQIACLQHDLGTLRTELATRDAKIVVLEKRLDESELKNDELEQYSRRNSLRLTGLAEKSDEDRGRRDRPRAPGRQTRHPARPSDTCKVCDVPQQAPCAGDAAGAEPGKSHLDACDARGFHRPANRS